jgi:peroxiredoxin
MQRAANAAGMGAALRRLALAVALLGACSGAAMAQQAQASLLHKKAPDFALTDIQGRQVDLKAYRGKVVLLNFWATWCTPCLLEMPRFMAWQKQYAEQGFQVIGISMDDDPAPVRSLSARLDLNYPLALGDEKIGDLYGGILGLPVTYLLGRDGEVLAEYRGETDLNAMEERLKALLHGK